MTTTNTVTFYVIRAVRDHVNPYDSEPLIQFNRSRPYEFRTGWYVAKEWTKDKFSQAKFFDSHGKASSYLKRASTIFTHYDRDPTTGVRPSIMTYFEIIPIEVQEPK